MSNRTLSLSPSPKRSVMRAAAMNTGLMILLAGVYLWSVAGNAIDTLRHLVERH